MIIWAALIPVVVVLGAPISGGWSVLLLALYPVQVARVSRGQRSTGRPRREAFAYGLSVVGGKFAQLHGLIRFLRDRILHRPATLIEYKGPNQSE